MSQHHPNPIGLAKSQPESYMRTRAAEYPTSLPISALPSGHSHIEPAPKHRPCISPGNAPEGPTVGNYVRLPAPLAAPTNKQPAAHVAVPDNQQTDHLGPLQNQGVHRDHQPQHDTMTLPIIMTGMDLQPGPGRPSAWGRKVVQQLTVLGRNAQRMFEQQQANMQQLDRTVAVHGHHLYAHEQHIRGHGDRLNALETSMVDYPRIIDLLVQNQADADARQLEMGRQLAQMQQQIHRYQPYPRPLPVPPHSNGMTQQTRYPSRPTQSSTDDRHATRPLRQEGQKHSIARDSVHGRASSGVPQS